MTDLPVLPYAGTSGHSGSDTSRERAEREDADGTTEGRQRSVLSVLSAAEADGATWHDIAVIRNWHHGQASGALSVLHKEGLVARLKQRRGKSAVYVLPEYVNGRETAAQGRRDPVDEALQEWLATDAAGWSKAGRDPRGFVKTMRALTGYGA
jgi:hypothetical protein